MKDKQTSTFQTRPSLTAHDMLILDECAELFSKVERHLFQDITAGKDKNALKRSYQKRFQITARHFNASKVRLEGKIASIKESISNRIKALKSQLASLDKTIRTCKNKQKRHQKKRRRDRLTSRLKQLEQDQKNNKVRLCFGGKKLFRAQFHLEENGFTNHQEWNKAWRAKRSSEFFLLGSKDETAGNQSCVLTPCEDGTFSLRLRLPDALVHKHGKYLFIHNIQIKYGQEAILNSLMSCKERKITKNNTLGQAISFLFKKDKKGWIIYLSTYLKKPTQITKEGIGAIGIDINANHIACVETDRFGNYLEKRTIPLNTYGKTKNQSLALIGDACVELVAWAEMIKKPIILEKLDFQKKKTTLKEETSKKCARGLSSFCYQKIIGTLTARAFRKGVLTHFVNPAYTSIIGHIKFAKSYGLTKHQGAALCIARRHYKFSEKPPQSNVITITDGKKGQLTLSLPERNRGKHVWSFWGVLSRKLRVALAEHFRAKKNRSAGPPKASPCDEKSPTIVGETPACESLAELFG